jgi:dihydropteroate synthase
LGAAKPAVMGILNVTPDSFSDGGRFFSPGAAIAQAERMAAEGADIIDVGAESTRPYGGAHPVSADEEIARLEPIFESVVKFGKPVSIDTMKASVARWAVARGAAVMNDVWGFQRDANLASLAAECGAPVVLMHNRAAADASIDILDDIFAFFERSLQIAAVAGVSRAQIILDPGIGFGKTQAQSIEVLGKLAELRRFGLPLLVGASRKRFIDGLSPSPPDQRLAGSIAAAIAAVEAGAAVVRVHDVKETVQALKVWRAIHEAA